MAEHKEKRTFKTYIRHGFVISRTAGPDAPWRGWREDGVTFRADTLQGAFQMAREISDPDNITDFRLL